MTRQPSKKLAAYQSTPRWVDYCYDSIGHRVGEHPEATGINLSRFLPLWALFSVMNQRGISQAELAEHMGLSRERVSQMFVKAADKRQPGQIEEHLLRLDKAVTELTDKLVLRSGGSDLTSLLPLLSTMEPMKDGNSVSRTRHRHDADLESWSDPHAKRGTSWGT